VYREQGLFREWHRPRVYLGEDSGYVIYHSKLTVDIYMKNVWFGRPWSP
jgi:hypothetical protein